MSSVAFTKFQATQVGARILKLQAGKASSACPDQGVIDQVCLSACIALAVGCWEGYIEAALREFVSKTRVQAHRKAWGLVVQFEAIVDRMASDLHTPNWEKTRELLITVTGMDPYGSWVWSPRFSNQTDTKSFFDGIMAVRHAFAHGYAIPPEVFGLTTPGILDAVYADDALNCIQFFAETTDSLLEHELIHRHSCTTGW